MLDIDIYKNEPRILKRRVEGNADGWRGTEISLSIAGNWSIYRSRVLQYFQQLAVITPYADLQLVFESEKDAKKNFDARFERRSTQLPPVSREIKPHPKSMNNIALSRLLQDSSCASLKQFLTTELSGISPSLAQQLAASVGLDGDTRTSTITSLNVAALCQVLRNNPLIRNPNSSNCLSPAGEYNLRLGVMKELSPRLVATFSDRPGTQDGHPFLVEAAISIGGPQIREGINVYRFANRIPLLFETGADMVTQVATKKINWNSYLIDAKKESIGVFVSVVSTRIPFKGTSKEYIGEDATEMMQSVKRALQGCCQQLRVSMARLQAKRDNVERRKTFEK